MQIKYYPKRDNSYNLIAGINVGFAVLLPDAYPGNKKWPWQLSVHGIGERSGGTEESLRNLVIGVDYNKDGKVDSVYVTPGQREAVDKYGLIIVVPTYESNTFFGPAQTHWVWNFMQQNFAVIPDYWYDGFSYGGGAALAAITDPATAPNIAYCTPCAPTNSLNKVNIGLIGQHNIPVHIYVNDEDDNGATNLSVTKSIIATINSANPSVKAVFTAFDKFGHGSHEEATTITPPKAPGGQGLIDAAENGYQVFLDILANGPRQMRTGTVTPAPPPTPLPAPIIAADFNLTEGQVITTTTFEMDASASTGAGSSWDSYKWDVKAIVAPTGKSYGVRPEGAYGGPKKKLIDIVDGEYEIILTIKDKNGNTASKKVKIAAKLSAERTLVSFNSTTDLATYSDGSTEKAEAIYSNGEWSLKTATGKILL